MKKMKKLLIVITACLFITTVVTAQEKRSIENKRTEIKQHRKAIVKDLNLTTEQKSKMKSINQDYKSKMMDLKSDDNITRGDFKGKMKKLQDARKSETQAVLSVEQQNKIKESKEIKKEEIKNKRKDRGEKIKSELNLTDDQQTTLKTNRKAMHAEIKTVKDNVALTKDEKREKIKTLKEKQKETMKTVLTPDQVQKLKDLKKSEK